jgi:transposase-like protein
MRTYSEELKAKMVAQMLPPHNRSVPELVKETGIPKDTLYTWRAKYRGEQEAAAGKGRGADGFTSAEKFDLVVQSAALNEHELGELCRRRGLFPEQLAAWRQSCREANESRPRREEQAERRELKKENQQLHNELRRKEKALAEAAALLVLEKKVQAIWGASAGASSRSRRDEP